MKSLALLILAACFLQTANAQNETLYLLHKDFSPAKTLEEADYFMQSTKENDSLYICRYYRKNGPMIRWESYSDPKWEKPNGIFVWYNEAGNIDSSGWVSNGKKDKMWNYGRGDSGRANITEYYENGRLQKRINYLTKMVTFPDGKTESLYKPVAEDSSLKTFTVVQVPARFKSGVSDWTKYITNNLKNPARFSNIYPSGTKGTVVVDFCIGKTGYVENAFIWRSVEWSVDTEALRVINRSPKWQPAVQNGKEVIYRHKQAVTFSASQP